MLRECPDIKVRFALSMTWDRLSRSLMPVVAEPVPCPRAFVVEFADILDISFPTLHMFAPWCHVIVNAQHPASRCTHHDVSPVLSFHLKKAPSSQTNTLLHTHTHVPDLLMWRLNNSGITWNYNIPNNILQGFAGYIYNMIYEYRYTFIPFPWGACPSTMDPLISWDKDNEDFSHQLQSLFQTDYDSFL